MPSRWPFSASALIGSHATLLNIDSVTTGSVPTITRRSQEALMSGESARTLSLVIRNLVFTVVVPGLGGAWLPWRILTRDGHAATPAAWEAVPVIEAGTALYVWCVWNFA